MIVNENVSLNSNVIVKQNDIDVPIIQLNANFNKSSQAFNLSFMVINNEVLTANSVDAQAQIDDFMVAIRSKFTELSYLIKI